MPFSPPFSLDNACPFPPHADMQNSNKLGRKEKPYRLANGEYVNGLRKRKNDGRWVVISTGQMFSEPDEAKAIIRFKQMIGETSTAKSRWNANELPALVEQIPFLIETPELWRAVAAEIIRRPKWCAEMTGIEKLGYLNDAKPTELPTLEAIETAWQNHGNVDQKEINLVLKSWKIFTDKMQIKSLDEITDAVCVGYRDHIYKTVEGFKTQQHRFSRARRMLTFARERAMIGTKELLPIMASMKLLTPADITTSIDPNPIEPADYRKLLEAATGDDRALLLLMLNTGMYLQEAVRTKWENIKPDGTLIAHRGKHGKVVRVAVLWQETLEALQAVQRKGDYVFISETGLPLTVSGAGKRYRKIRKAAGVSTEVKANQIRDGAASAADDAGITESLVNRLMGHRNKGESDKYAKRTAKAVKPVVDAIYKRYFC